MHKRYQKGTEDTAALDRVRTMTSTVCVPVWLPSCSGLYASKIRQHNIAIQLNWDILKLFYRLLTEKKNKYFFCGCSMDALTSLGEA